MNDIFTSLWTLSAVRLRDEIASTHPTPGGGSASIVAAVLGVASIQKGVAVSHKKSTENSSRRKYLSQLCSNTAEMMCTLSELADADSVAFQGYLEASTLPHTTETEKMLRQATTQANLLRATQVPLEAAAEMCRCLEIAQAAAEVVDTHVRSEVLAGEILLRAAIKAVLLSVDANLSGISDTTIRDMLRLQRDGLERSSALMIETDITIS